MNSKNLDNAVKFMKLNRPRATKQQQFEAVAEKLFEDFETPLPRAMELRLADGIAEFLGSWKTSEGKRCARARVVAMRPHLIDAGWITEADAAALLGRYFPARLTALRGIDPSVLTKHSAEVHQSTLAPLTATTAVVGLLAAGALATAVIKLRRRRTPSRTGGRASKKRQDGKAKATL